MMCLDHELSPSQQNFNDTFYDDNSAFDRHLATYPMDGESVTGQFIIDAYCW
jgi:hypothetical protein